MKTLKELQKDCPTINIKDLPKSQGTISFGFRMYDLLVTGKYKIIFDFDVYLPQYKINLQRPYVWDDIQKEELIWSLIYERVIPSCVIISHEYKCGDIVYQVIDGKQRLITIQKFMKNEFPIHISGKEVFWDDMDSDLHYHLNKKADILVQMYYSYYDAPITDEQKIILFNFYNFAGTSQELSHKNKLLNIQKQFAI